MNKGLLFIGVCLGIVIAVLILLVVKEVGL